MRKTGQLALFENASPVDLIFTFNRYAGLDAVIKRISSIAIRVLGRRPLPLPYSRADRLFTKLLDCRSAALHEAIARNLDAITTAGPYEFEATLGSAWSEVFSEAEVDVYTRFVWQRTGPIALDALTPILAEAADDKTRTILRQRVVAVLPDAFQGPTFDCSPPVAAAIAEAIQNREIPPRMLAELRARVRSGTAHDKAPSKLYKALMDADVAANLLETSTLRDLQDRGLLELVAALQPQTTITLFLKNPLDQLLGSIAPSVPPDCLTPLAVLYGRAAAERAKYRDIPPEEMAAELAREVFKLEAPPEAFELQTRLWFLLERISHSHGVERTGLETRLKMLVDAHPEAWALALPQLLEHREKNSAIDVMTISLAIESPIVYAALEKEAATDDAAFGLLTTVGGGSPQTEWLGRALLDFVARHLDGTPSYPHPLELRSSTWMTTLGLEQILRSEIASSEARFRTYFETHWSAIEETNTERLVTELEVGFRDADRRLQNLASAGKSQAATVTVSRREILKSVEEPRFGCDVAFLTRAHVAGSLNFETAELVQVKKSKASGGKQRNDAWTIDVKQLDKLLKASQSACYWLITAQGELLTVPAKVIRGMLNARKSLGKTVTVGYNAVRSAAIGLPQFFTDLLIGGWIGDMSPEALEIAHGTSKTTRPQLVLEVEVRCGERRG